MTIGARIACGFLAVLLLTVAVAFIGWRGLSTYAQQVRQAAETAEMEVAIKNIRLDELRFSVTQDVAIVELVHKGITKLHKNASHILSLIHDEAERAPLGEVLKTLERYTVAFENFVVQHKEEKTHIAALEKRASDLKNAAEKIAKQQSERYQQNISSLNDANAAVRDRMDISALADVVTVRFLTARRALADYLRTRETNFAGEVRVGVSAAATTAKDLLKRLQGTDDETQVGKIIEALDSFQRDFDALIAAAKDDSNNKDNSKEKDAATAIADKDKPADKDKLVNSKEERIQALATSLTAKANQALSLARTIQSDQMAGVAALREAADVARHDVDESVMLQDIAHQMIQATLAARLAERDFRLTEGHAGQNDVQLALANLLKLVDKAAAAIVDTAGKAALEGMRTAAKAYQQDFSALETAYSAQARAEKEMAEAVSDVGDRVEGAVALQAEAREYGRSDVVRFMISSALVALALGAACAWVIGRGITHPLHAITDAMRALADGNLTITIPGRERRDEIRLIAGALEVFKHNAEGMQRMEAERETLREQAEIERRRATAAIADGFEASVSGVIRTLTQAADALEHNAQTLSSDAEHTSDKAATVAMASEQASHNVETVAAATEELTASIGEITRQLSDSSRVAASAANQTQHTNTVVEGLAGAAQRIGDVVRMIQEIAEQTNLLALNATIEAARAGEAGKGFAVVASEVKNLANQTARATEEITSQIGAMQNATGSAVTAIRDINNSVNTLSSNVAAIAAAMEEQGAATQEIARNVQQAAGSTQTVRHNIAEVTESAEKTGSTANTVLTASRDLARQAERLSHEVEGFLGKVRAG